MVQLLFTPNLLESWTNTGKGSADGNRTFGLLRNPGYLHQNRLPFPDESSLDTGWDLEHHIAFQMTKILDSRMYARCTHTCVHTKRHKNYFDLSKFTTKG